METNIDEAGLDADIPIGDDAQPQELGYEWLAEEERDRWTTWAVWVCSACHETPGISYLFMINLTQFIL